MPRAGPAAREGPLVGGPRRPGGARDDANLILAQWLSPAFPVGGFAYSHGLEAAMSDGDVSGADDVQAWISDILRHGAGASDTALLGAAMQPDADHLSLDATAQALCTARERWIETRDQGAAFTATTNAVEGWDDPPAALPVAVGRASGRIGAEPELVATLYLQALATNLALAAVRFLPLGGADGQRIVAALRPVCRSVARVGVVTPVGEIVLSAIGADYAAMRHERLAARTFRT
jgi:urease accessory protein